VPYNSVKARNYGAHLIKAKHKPLPVITLIIVFYLCHILLVTEALYLLIQLQNKGQNV